MPSELNDLLSSPASRIDLRETKNIVGQLLWAEVCRSPFGGLHKGGGPPSIQKGHAYQRKVFKELERVAPAGRWESDVWFSYEDASGVNFASCDIFSRSYSLVVEVKLSLHEVAFRQLDKYKRLIEDVVGQRPRGAVVCKNWRALPYVPLASFEEMLGSGRDDEVLLWG